MLAAGVCSPGQERDRGNGGDGDYAQGEADSVAHDRRPRADRVADGDIELPRLHLGASPSATLLQFLQGRGEHQGEALDVEEIGWLSAAAQLKTRLITVCVGPFVLPFYGRLVVGATPWTIGSGGFQSVWPSPRRHSHWSGKPGDQASKYARTALQHSAMPLRVRRPRVKIRASSPTIRQA